MGNASAKRLADSYGQPLVTYNENLLIKAEALFKGGNLQAALDTLNKERASWATTTPWHTAITLTAVTGPVTLEQIMNEKYVVLFQNIETWNDYKRTCYPALVPGNGAVAIPGRSVVSDRRASNERRQRAGGSGSQLERPNGVHRRLIVRGETQTMAGPAIVAGPVVSFARCVLSIRWRGIRRRSTRKCDAPYRVLLLSLANVSNVAIRSSSARGRHCLPPFGLY